MLGLLCYDVVLEVLGLPAVVADSVEDHRALPHLVHEATLSGLTKLALRANRLAGLGTAGRRPGNGGHLKGG